LTGTRSCGSDFAGPMRSRRPMPQLFGPSPNSALRILYCDTSPLQAFDVVVHLPHINVADPDLSAFAHAPEDIQQALRHAKQDQ
jgi:hypothetical protein